MAGEPSLFLVYQSFTATEREGVSWHVEISKCLRVKDASSSTCTQARTVPLHETLRPCYRWTSRAVGATDIALPTPG